MSKKDIILTFICILPKYIEIIEMSSQMDSFLNYIQLSMYQDDYFRKYECQNFWNCP